MKGSSCQVALGLSLSMMVSLGGEVSAQSMNTSTLILSPQTSLLSSNQSQDKQGSELVRLYYLRSAEQIVPILTAIVMKNDSLKDIVIQSQSENIIVLYGKKTQREELKRIIAILDLPRERVNMDMWGILISSDNPEQLAEAMRKINATIDTTQKLIRKTYQTIENYTRKNGLDSRPGDEKIDPDFKKVFADKLGYQTAFDPDRPTLSMTDILLIQLARKNPPESFDKAATDLEKIFKDKYYEPYVKYLKEHRNSEPFENYLNVGLRKGFSQEDQEEINLRHRGAVLDFALQYSRLKSDPSNFDPLALQQSAETLNSILNPVIDALNRDVEELFIEPTLDQIQHIVSKYDAVKYAEVGKTSVAGLNGIQSEVTSQTVSAFDETGPLRINELIEEAGKLNPSSKDLLPSDVVNFGAQTIPVASVVSLVAALSKDRSAWRGLTSGVSMTITPSVLRNSASAELQIDLTTGPQKDQEKEVSFGVEKLRPLSRISQNTVKTSVYVNTLDIFALSTFNSQTTEDGGRWYIPVIGTVWQGVFSGIPVFGELFSFQNPPNNVQHQSIVLTNSFIVPTAMGLAHLYQVNKKDYDFYNSCTAVETYISYSRKEINSSKSDTYVFGGDPLLDRKIQTVCGERKEETQPPKESKPQKSGKKRGNLG